MNKPRMNEIRGMYEWLLDAGVASDIAIGRYLVDVGDLLAHSVHLEAENNTVKESNCLMLQEIDRLEAEREIYQGLVEAATLFNGTYLTGDGKTVVASWNEWVDFDAALRKAVALSEQKSPKKSYKVVKMECFIHGEWNPEEGPNCPKCALPEQESDNE